MYGASVHDYCSFIRLINEHNHDCFILIKCYSISIIYVMLKGTFALDGLWRFLPSAFDVFCKKNRRV